MHSKICRFIQQAPPVFKFAFLSNILLLLWLFRDVVSYFFPVSLFFMVLLALPFLIVYFTTLILSALYATSRFKQFGTKSVLPFLVHVCVLGLVLTVNFTPIWLNLNFHLFALSREDVAALVKSGQIKVGEYGNTQLPPQYLWTSCGGTIDVSKSSGTMSILFYTFSGFDSLAGYIYTDRDGQPDLDHFSRGKILEFHKLRDRWYWFSST